MGRVFTKIALGVILGTGILSQPNYSQAKFLWFGGDPKQKDIELKSDEERDYSNFEVKKIETEPVENTNIGIGDESLIPKPGRREISSDDKGFLEGYFENLYNLIQADYGKYLPFPEFKDTKFYQDNVELIAEDEYYRFDGEKLLFEAGGEWFNGFRRVQDIKKDIKKYTSTEMELEKVKVGIGAEYSRKHFIKPYLEIENFIFDKWRLGHELGEKTVLEAIKKFDNGTYIGLQASYAYNLAQRDYVNCGETTPRDIL